ncbi:MAG: DMT family transporter [Erysipelotrichaceae bacterium]|nr:DMT family transporter [Erysipelotrichaceae bacterium]MDP3305235.1 DMT family transporter [Erysipelotrichaceae bacterium]
MDKKLKSVWLALFVTFLWSTSWVLIKVGLVDIPALPFAGLRYLFASLFLFIYMLASKKMHLISSLSKQQWKTLLIYGFVLITLTQGAQFLALSMLPAVTLSLFLNMSPIFVLFLGYFFLNETINRVQLFGIILFFLGIIIYFYQVDLGNNLQGLLLATFGVFINAIAAVYGRSINAKKDIDPMVITMVITGFGSIFLLLGGIAIQGVPVLNFQGWLIVGWLAAVNTALAFTLWNVALRELKAVEANTINNTMLIQIALLAAIFLNESLSARQWLAIAVVAVGVWLVQLRKN